MSRYSSHDPYLDPATGVLRNRFGITDEATLEATEASLVALRSYVLAQQPLAGGFDLAHLQAIPLYLFGDVYDWAGQLRTIDIARGGNASRITPTSPPPPRRSSLRWRERNISRALRRRPSAPARRTISAR